MSNIHDVNDIETAEAITATTFHRQSLTILNNYEVVLLGDLNT